MVYSFFEPDEAARSLGTLMVLDHIARARRMGLAYVYLGYWVRGSRKMDYKSRFLPQERLTPDGWARVGINPTSEQPRRRVSQYLAARFFVRRPIVKQIEQMAVIGHTFAAIEGCGQSVPHISMFGLARTSASCSGRASPRA